MNLVAKYNVPAPRYTSYPTVPMWDEIAPEQDQWKDSVKFTFAETNGKDGISIYIHLPFCESLCTYCGCNTRITVNHRVESPYIKAVLSEWALYLEIFEETPRINEIHLGGGTPTFFSPENLKQLIEGITSSATLCADAALSFEAHPQNTTEEHLLALYSVGFRRVSYGIQDFDPKVQKVINRIQTYEQVKFAVDAARRVGFTSVNFDLIYGLPLQTIASVTDTIAKVKELMPDRIAFYSYAHVPWVVPGQRKYTELDLPTGLEKLNLYECGKNLLLEAGYYEIGLDHFALQGDELFKALQTGSLHRNFMGYTCKPTKLLIGLGASSISDTWHGLVQNVKKVEVYQEMVNQGILPFFKGHILNNEDVILRQHILNLMCKHETQWLNSHEQCEAVFESHSHLKELELDGLVEIGDYYCRITEKGKPFLRNICMAFDAKLWRSKKETELFSSAV